MYRQDTSKEDFYTSPMPGHSSGILAPLSLFNVDARRNSDVSALSLSSFTTYASDFSVPSTPICGRSPFSAESFDATILDLNHTQSNQLVPIDFHTKPSCFDESIVESWNFTDTPNHLAQALAISSKNSLASQSDYSNSQSVTYTGMDAIAATAAHSWGSNSSGTTYTDFESLQGLDELRIDPCASLPSMDYYQIQPPEMMIPQTPGSHILLDGGYVHVDAAHDIEMEQYDDTDVPLSLSPHCVEFKQESSPIWVKPEHNKKKDEKSTRRSICETRTGGKSIKIKQRSGGVSNNKAKGKKAKARAVTVKMENGKHTVSKMEDGKSILSMMEDGKVQYNWDAVFKGADGKYHFNGPREKRHCCPEITLDENPKICGKPFKRPEHLQRHMKTTHNPDKPYLCMLCEKSFNRNDNCWAHGFTHVRQPGKKDGRNPKFSLRQVISVLADPKNSEAQLKKWSKAVGGEYIPENEENDNPKFMKAVRECDRMDASYVYDVEDAIRKIRSLSA